MAIPILKLAMKAKDLPEVVIIGRVVLGIVGVFVLIPVATNLRHPGDLSPTDYIGLVVFAAVGLWLLAVAIRGRQ